MDFNSLEAQKLCNKKNNYLKQQSIKTTTPTSLTDERLPLKPVRKETCCKLHLIIQYKIFPK